MTAVVKMSLKLTSPKSQIEIITKILIQNHFDEGENRNKNKNESVRLSFRIKSKNK